ncbi:MAG: nicotinate (nicotinamide) nucleotide adenylyltransferase [Bacilli bacterium]
MRIGIYNGTFNPVHKAHIKICKKLIKKGYVDKIIIIPTEKYWDKKSEATIFERIDMLKLITTDKIILNADLYSLSRTYDVLKELEKIYPQATFSLIIGADNIINFSDWYKYEELLKYNLIIMQRKNIKVKKYLIKLNKKNNYHIVSFRNSISSSKIRNYINQNKLGKVKRYLDKKVYDYIIENNLYRLN